MLDCTDNPPALPVSLPPVPRLGTVPLGSPVQLPAADVLLPVPLAVTLLAVPVPVPVLAHRLPPLLLPLLCRLLQLGQLLPDLYEAQMELAPEMIGQTAVVVVDAEISRAYLKRAPGVLRLLAQVKRSFQKLLSHVFFKHNFFLQTFP